MFAINATQEKNLNKACKANQDVALGTILANVCVLEPQAHTVVAGDVGATNTVVDLPFDGTPVAGIFTAINNAGLEVTGYTVTFAAGKATVTIAKASLPVDSKVFAILW